VADVAAVLEFFGPTATYGLRAVELRPRSGEGVAVATLHVPGVIVLFEQPSPPWVVRGRLDARSYERLNRAGARVTDDRAWTEVDWPGESLRQFMLFDGLMHEIGHHRVQHGAGPGPGRRRARVRRTADHERHADAFAARCRAQWASTGPA
jgi:hypothetical protein